MENATANFIGAVKSRVRRVHNEKYMRNARFKHDTTSSTEFFLKLNYYSCITLFKTTFARVIFKCKSSVLINWTFMLETGGLNLTLKLTLDKA